MTADVGLRLILRDAGAGAALRTLVGRLRNRTALHQELADGLLARVDQRFETSQDPTGVAWAAWKPATVKARARKGLLPGRLLVAHTPGLRTSLSSEADAESGRVGFGLPHAVYHEYGTRRMARRGLLTADPRTGALGDRDAALLLQVVRDYLEAP